MAENDNDKTNTYGNSENNKTGTYGNSESQKTTAYNSKQEETSAYTDLQNKEFKSRTHGIGIGDKVILKGKEFSVVGIISEGTGEATIYKVEDSSESTFALKLYFEFSNVKEEPNPETLERIRKITDPDILKLYDFGTGREKYQDKYCFEISDFGEGGDLFSVADFKSKYTKDFIEKNVVPEILNGIWKLQEFKIYHCDLKPGNVFFKDKNQTDLLIGDYGSAKAYDLETKEVRKTSTVKGTDTYLPPEQARGIISEKNDYYSFGMILLHLLYPEYLADDNTIRQVDKEKFEKIVARQYNSQPIVDFNPEYKRLNNLIGGLTLVNHINRFGREEVEKWLKGEEVEVKYRAVEASSIQPIKLGYATIKTDKDFIHVLETQPNWYDDLIEDQDTFATVKSWMDSYRDIPSRKVFNSMIKFYQQFGKDYVKESLLRYFDPQRDIIIESQVFNFFSSENPEEDIKNYISGIDKIWKHGGSDAKYNIEKIRFYLFQLEFSLWQLKIDPANGNSAVGFLIDKKLYTPLGLQPLTAAFADYKTQTQTKITYKDEAATYRLLIELFYTSNPDRTFKDLNNNPITTIDDLGIYYIKNEANFENKYLKIEKERFLQKLNKSELSSLDYKQFVFEVFKDKAETQIELINLTFDKHRDYKVNYKFYKSLNSFLSQKHISTDFTSRSDSNEIYKNRRRFFQPFKTECENFISTVTQKHNITTLTNENLSKIRKKFNTDSWKRYLYIYSGQFLALLIAIPLAIAVYGIATHQFHIGNGSNFKRGMTDNHVTPAVTHRFYTVKTDANVRSGASEHTSIIGKAKKGQEIEVLEASNSKWYKVKVYNTIGYISSKLLSYSRSSNSLVPQSINSSTPTKTQNSSSGSSNEYNSTSSSVPATPPAYNNSSDNSSNTTLNQNSAVEPTKQYQWVLCSDCNGSGNVSANSTCSSCIGQGSNRCTVCAGIGSYSCTTCGGVGSSYCTVCAGIGSYVVDYSNGRRITCSNCNGKGRYICNTCGGRGKHICSNCNGKAKTVCNSCSGKGTFTTSGTCQRCNGKGQIQKVI